MLEIPAVLPQDHEKTSALSVTKGFFRKLESEEIKMSKGVTQGKLRYVEPLSEDRFVGLVSSGVFDKDGNLIGDVFSLHVRESIGHKRGMKFVPGPKKFMRSEDEFSILSDHSQSSSKVDTDDIDGSDDDTIKGIYNKMLSIESFNGVSGVSMQIVATQWGCCTLARNTYVPRVRRSKASSFSAPPTLSEKARKILIRTNYRNPLTLDFCRTDDFWYNNQFLRRRSLQCMTSVLYTSLYRKDYQRAYRALSLLIREPMIELRLLWMPSIELLAWRVSKTGSRGTPLQFIDYLIANFPDVPALRLSMYRYMPRAPDFAPVQLMLLLKHKEFRKAVELGDQIVNSAIFNSDALCWSLYGIALLKEDKKKNKNQVEKCFRRCVQLGGVLAALVPEVRVKDNTENENESASSNSSDNEEEYQSSQPFYSQGSIGVKVPSDSDEEIQASSQPFFSQGSIGADFGSSDGDESEVAEKFGKTISGLAPGNTENDFSTTSESSSVGSDESNFSSTSESDLTNFNENDTASVGESEAKTPSDNSEPSSQPFYSQGSIGALLGSSESEIDV